MHTRNPVKTINIKYIIPNHAFKPSQATDLRLSDKQLRHDYETLVVGLQDKHYN